MLLNSRFVKTVAVHALIWVTYIVYESLLFVAIDSRSLNIWETGLNFALNAVLFYVTSLVILPRFLVPRRYAALLLSITLLLGVFLLARYQLNTCLIPAFNTPMVRPVGEMKVFWAESIWRGGYFLFFSFAYWFAITSFRNEQNKRILEEQRREREEQLREMQQSLMEAEMAFLKSQINPHFLFNALNFFYAQVYPYSEDTARGILLLSDIMRYALKEEEGTGKVMLEHEVNHLHNFISINQLRFGNRLQVKLEIAGSLQFRMIMPLLLITFVENCFKHGELLDPKNPVLIRLEVDQEKLSFHTHNRKKEGHKEKSTGIGLANTRKRLELMYKERYVLRVEDTPGTYSCQLTLNL